MVLKNNTESWVEDKREKLDHSAEQNVGEFQDTIKRPNFKINEHRRGRKPQKGIKSVFRKIIEVSGDREAHSGTRGLQITKQIRAVKKFSNTYYS